MAEYCDYCKKIIPENRKRKNARYCSENCRKAHTHELYIADYPGHRNQDLPRGTVGAIHELYVCTDLMSRGYHIFRAMSPSCPCDLIAIKDRIFKIEVTTGVKYKSGIIGYAKHNSENYSFDLIAVVLHDGEIHYYSNEGDFIP